MRIGPIELLATLKKDLIADEPRVNFNYIEFTTFCLTIMRKLFDSGTSRLTKHEYESLRWYYELVHFLMRTAADAKASSCSVSSTPFSQAAAAMQTTLASRRKQREEVLASCLRSVEGPHPESKATRIFPSRYEDRSRH